MVNFYYIFLLLFFKFFFLNSQSIIVEYKIKIDSLYLKENKLNVNEIYYKHLEFQDLLNYELHANKNESIYYLKETSKKHIPSNLINIVTRSGGKGEFYTKFKDSISFNKKNFLGQLFIIKEKMPNWLITNETKKIDSVLVYKAIFEKQMDNGKKKYISKTTVWFAPSIPYSIGPKSLFGLPGLIMEVQEKEILICLSKITFLQEDLKINFQKKGIEMTDKEFNDYLIENSEDLLKSLIKN
jgi:GLPGLI family protein